MTTPYEFAQANIDGLNATNMINTSVITNREMVASFKQPTRVAYVGGTPSFASGDFIEWEMPQTYESDTTDDSR